MSLDGSGNYAPPTPEFPAISGEYILAADFNAIILDLAAALSAAVYRDGQGPMTANLAAGGFKITNLAAGTLAADSTTYGQLTAAVGIIDAKFTNLYIGNVTFTATHDYTGATLTVALQTPLDSSAKAASTAFVTSAVGVEEAARLAAVAGEAATRLATDNLKVNLAGGNTITGTQNLTGAVVNVAEPVTASNPTSLQFVTNCIGAANPVLPWVSGQTYTLGMVVWSLINFQTYRHITATSSLTVDPAADGVNWVALGANTDLFNLSVGII